MQTNISRLFAFALLALSLLACGGESKPAATEATEPGTPTAPGEPSAPSLKAGPGVDVANKTIRLGVLNDESGPAATIGKPYAAGKRLVAALANDPSSGLLPAGWKVELVEKDHGYNPQKSVQAYNEIKDNVLMVVQSFGTPNTLPLRPMLERDQMLALPASLSSQMAENKFTIPNGPSYEIEAMRAMDWVVAEVEKAGKSKDTIKAAVVYQQDDYGQDGLNGWKKAADKHGVKVVSEQTVRPGERDFTAVVTGLKQAGATHVLLTVLPSASGPLLGTAAQLQVQPVWIGNTPSWVDAFWKPETIPPAVFKNFHWVSGMPYWGDDSKGMPKFIEAYEKHGKALSAPDFYVLMSYTQGVLALELIKRAIEAGDITREGVLAQIPKVASFDAQGLLQPMSLDKVPYVTGTKARVLKGDFEKKTWTVLGDWATPAAL
jgi:ABC-type branched-subunit amino acid transport system substrate-binding protein